MSRINAILKSIHELRDYTARFARHDPTLEFFNFSRFIDTDYNGPPTYLDTPLITSFLGALVVSQSPLSYFEFSYQNTSFSLVTNGIVTLAVILLEKQLFFRLNELILSGLIHLNSTAAIAIATLLTTTTMRLDELVLSDCPIGDEGMIALTDALEHENSRITYLDVQNCSIGNRGILYLTRSIERGNVCFGGLKRSDFTQVQRTIGAYASSVLRRYVEAPRGNRVILDVDIYDNPIRLKVQRRFDWAMHIRDGDKLDDDDVPYTYGTFFHYYNYTDDERDDNYATDEEDEL